MCTYMDVSYYAFYVSFAVSTIGMLSKVYQAGTIRVWVCLIGKVFLDKLEKYVLR